MQSIACEMIHFGVRLPDDNHTVAHLMSGRQLAIAFHGLYMCDPRGGFGSYLLLLT